MPGQVYEGRQHWIVVVPLPGQKKQTGRVGRVAIGRRATPWKRRLAAAGTKAAPSPALTKARIAWTWLTC